MAQAQGRPLIWYRKTIERSLEAMLPQCNDEGKEKVLYYISLIMIGVEIN